MTKKINIQGPPGVYEDGYNTNNILIENQFIENPKTIIARRACFTIAGILMCAASFGTIEHIRDINQIYTDKIHQEQFTPHTFTTTSNSDLIQYVPHCDRLITEKIDPKHPPKYLHGNQENDMPHQFIHTQGHLDHQKDTINLYFRQSAPIPKNTTLDIENYSPTFVADNPESNKTTCEAEMTERIKHMKEEH